MNCNPLLITSIESFEIANLVLSRTDELIDRDYFVLYNSKNNKKIVIIRNEVFSVYWPYL